MCVQPSRFNQSINHPFSRCVPRSEIKFPQSLFDIVDTLENCSPPERARPGIYLISGTFDCRVIIKFRFPMHACMHALLYNTPNRCCMQLFIIRGTDRLLIKFTLYNLYSNIYIKNGCYLFIYLCYSFIRAFWRTDGWTDGRKDGRAVGRMHAHTHTRTHARMDSYAYMTKIYSP